VGTTDLVDYLTLLRERITPCQDTVGLTVRRNFFAGAKAREVTSFPAGPMGGRLSCGYTNTEHGEVTVCAWSDAATFGFLTLVDVARLDDAAPIAVAFRTAAERRS
jgi:hypothetical protein